jgi:hypothetical protein
MPLGLALLVMLLASACSGSGTAASSAQSGPALAEIDATRLDAHLRFLSHDLLEGRAPSTRGGQLAAEYLATQLALLGFAPGASDGTYFQQVGIVESVVDPSFTLRVGAGAPFRYLQDVVAFSGKQAAEVRTDGEVVFVGYGIVAPEYRWNDYDGIDMADKVALIMVNDPPATADEPQLFGGDALTYYGRWTYKLEEAARQGAAGALLIHTDESATYPWQVVQTSWSGTQYSLPVEPGQPVLGMKAWVSNAAAMEIARRAGKDLEALRTAARARGAKPVPLGIRASATIAQTVVRRTTPNVIGVLGGKDSSRAVLYTAHYDHSASVGPAATTRRAPIASSTGAIDMPPAWPGADDRASLRAGGPRRPRIRSTSCSPRRGIGAAGRGVLRAPARVAGRPVAGQPQRRRAEPGGPHARRGAARRRAFHIGSRGRGAGKAPRRVIGPDPEPGRGHFYRSDHFPLAKAGVPALSLGDPREYLGRDPSFAKRIRDQYNDTTTTSRPTTTGPPGTCPALSRTCGCWRNWGGRLPTARTCPPTTRPNSSPAETGRRDPLERQHPRDGTFGCFARLRQASQP